VPVHHSAYFGMWRTVRPHGIALRGSITVNGIQLEQGAISLRPVDGHSAPAAVTTVEMGAYRFTSENCPGPVPMQ
jgi:hypothetical protein